jgi:hypothetical protein
MPLAVRVLHLKQQFLLALEDLEVDQIAGGNAIDPQQPIPRLKAKLLTNRSGLHRRYDCGIGPAGGGRGISRRGISGNQAG